MREPKVVQEHEKIDWELPSIEYKGFVDGKLFHLGIKNKYASYYVGADWLSDNEVIDTENDVSIIVIPKIENLDFVSLFSSALDVDDEQAFKYFSQSFDINFDRPEIKAPQLDSVLSPLIMILFIKAVERVLSYGLKRGYVEIEKNLECKMKGKLIIGKQIRCNTFNGMNHRLYCRYFDYSYDIPENRMLKKALLFTHSYFRSKNLSASLLAKISILLGSFDSVSDDVEIYELKQSKSNKLFKEYKEALKLAMMILKRFGYSLLETSSLKETVPVFWIDMSRIFEMHVLSMLRKKYGNHIFFQVNGYRGKERVDFVKDDEHLILDAKYKRYKKQYNEDDDESVSMDDIRELAGYARDKRLREKMNVEENCRDYLNCIIIYPDVNVSMPLWGNLFMETPLEEIEGFAGFYKLAVPVPILKNVHVV